MRRRTRRGPGARLVLTLAALASLIVGYYLGQSWQRRPLDGLSAVVYPDGRKLDYPAGLGIADGDAEAGLWRLFLVADTRRPACRELLRHHGFVINRLAPWPDVQARLRVTLLAYDRPDAAAITALRGGAEWLEVVSADSAALDRLAGQLGIQPAGPDWCSPTQANGILVSPQRRSWALIPHEDTAIMARNLQTIITFVE